MLPLFWFQELFERDVECIVRFFSKKLGYVPERDEELEVVRPSFQVGRGFQQISRGFWKLEGQGGGRRSNLVDLLW